MCLSSPHPLPTPLGPPAAFTPSSFNFAGASPAGPGTGTQQQAGSVSPQGTQASSNVAGTGELRAAAVGLHVLHRLPEDAVDQT